MDQDTRWRCGQQSSGTAAERPDTPLRNFAAAHSAPGTGPRSAGWQRSEAPLPIGPGRSTVSSSAPGARSWHHDRAFKAQPNSPRPRTGAITAVRHDMVDHGRGNHVTLDLAGGTQRVPRQEGGPGPPPAGTVAPACRTRALPLQLRFDHRRAPRPERTVHRRLRRQRRLTTSKNPPQRSGAGRRDTLFVLG
jgi:hypothetical protein